MSFRIAGIAIFALVAFAADDPKPLAKLTTMQIQQLNDATKDAQIAKLQQQVAELKQQLIVATACSDAGIPISKCDLMPDGSLVSKKEEKK